MELWANRDDFGEITKGRLTILGRVFEAIWQPERTELPKVYNGPNFSLCIGEDTFSGVIELDTAEDWISQKARSSPVLQCMPILLRRVRDVMWLKGLVINPVDELGDEFTRVGIFSVSSEVGIYQGLDEYLKTYQMVKASRIRII